MSKIVVIAHDNCKPDLLDFLMERKSWFFGRQIVATGRTAEYLEGGKLNLPLIHVNKGSDGGYLQIVEMIRRANSMNDATEPSDAIDEALKAFDSIEYSD